MIPQDENPEVNFIGLLIGPRLVMSLKLLYMPNHVTILLLAVTNRKSIK